MQAAVIKLTDHNNLKGYIHLIAQLHVQAEIYYAIMIMINRYIMCNPKGYYKASK